MKFASLKGLALGILAAVGGFVDMGGIITSSQAGAVFRFSLLWTLIPGVVGLIIYADMSGRVVIASGRTLFDVIRDRLGSRLALIPLLATAVVNTLTLVIEIAGMAIVLQLATRLPYLFWFLVAAFLLVVIMWKASFEMMENGTAVLGLAMLVSVVAMIKLHPPWGQVLGQAVHPSTGPISSLSGYLFATVSLLGAYMTPYQFYFYSSGAIEDEWSGGDLLLNRITTLVGSVFGAVVDIALMVTAGLVLFPKHAQVTSLQIAGAPVVEALGPAGWFFFLLGTFAVCTGAGLETALSGAYSVCQYFGWDWGKRGRPRQAPLFHLGYIVMIVLAVLLALTGIDPIQLTLITMAVAAATLPFTFIPLLIVANDEDFMGEQKNTLSINIAAGVILVILVIVTVVAVPLAFVSGGKF